jgi:hypothetical protein
LPDGIKTAVTHNGRNENLSAVLSFTFFKISVFAKGDYMMKKLPVLLIGSTLFLFMLFLFIASPGGALAKNSTQFPDIIPLPDGFRPEGVVIGRGSTIYAGSLADGSVYRANLRTGDGEVFISGQSGLLAVGLSYDGRSNYLYVSGGPGGDARVYDAYSGALLASYQLIPPGTGFINDAIVTREAVYFTNSFVAEYYRLPLDANGRLPDAADVETIPLAGDFVQVGGFNANGIEASANGRYLIIVNSSTGTLFRLEPGSSEALAIDLGGEVVTSGDGLVLQGNTLYVVRNSLNQVAVVELSADFTQGEVVDTLTSPDFRIPTTADIFGSSLYAVNARFDTPPTPDTEYEIVRVAR